LSICIHETLLRIALPVRFIVTLGKAL